MFDRFTEKPARRSKWWTLAIAGSVAGHLGLAFALIFTTLWHLEKLTPEATRSAFAARSGPSAGDMGGAPPPPIKKQSVKKPEKKVVKDMVQPPRTIEVDIDYDANAVDVDDGASEDGHSNGVLHGTGTDPNGFGSGTHGTGGHFDGFDDIDVSEPDAVEYQCDDGVDNDDDGDADCSDSDCDSAAACQETQVVPQDFIEGLRISGTTQIHPPESVRVKMIHLDVHKLTASVKMCLSTTGGVNSLSVLDSTDHPEYDRKLLREMRGWKYRPYTVNGKPVPVCTSVLFVYKLVD
jgi:TonB family protein